MNEKLKKMILIVIVVFVIIFIFLFMMTSCKKKYLPQELELEIVDSANYYYKNHVDELPKDGSSMVLSLNDLVVKGIIDDLDDILEKNTICSGALTIENNNNYYMFSPNISCASGNESYITVNLKDTLLENITTVGNGLYNINNEYYFRGENVDNYIIFDGILWRIVKINSDNTIKLIQDTKNETVTFDNRYNSDKQNSNGYNDLIYNNINSRIKDTLDTYYKGDDIFSDKSRGFIKKTTLCIGKRSETDTLTDGSIECSITLPDQYLGLIQVNEFMIASLDENCTTTTSSECRNYNYLANMDKAYWSLTADSSNTYKVFKISKTVDAASASSSAMARIVINISENTNVTGTGTVDDPYIVVGFDSELKKLQ